MGNDGGSIPDRRDLVRTKAKSEQADKANQTLAKWAFCALSKKPLEEPVVGCDLGKMYNKQELIAYLLDKKGSTFGDGEKICGHIRSLKDVKELRLTKNTTKSSSTDSDSTSTRAQFVCPLTLKEMNGVLPFVFLTPCGCVMSTAGLKAMTVSPGSTSDTESTPPSEELSLCPQCSTKFNKKDHVRNINPTPEEEYEMRNAMLLRRAAEPVKSKKSKKRKAEDEAEAMTKKSKASDNPAPALNPTVAAASRAVTQSLAEEEAKRKAKMSAAVKSLYGDGTKRKETFMTMGTFTRYA